MDYNAPATASPLSSAVRLPPLPSSLSIRFVVVPSHVHASALAKYGGSKQLQFLEYACPLSPPISPSTSTQTLTPIFASLSSSLLKLHHHISLPTPMQGPPNKAP